MLTQYSRCRCRAEFCYVCGAKWKTCRCPRWHEERLLERAEQVVRRQPTPAPTPQLALPQDPAAIARDVATADLAYQERIRHMANAIQDEDECEHVDEWEVIDHDGVCEMCDDHLPDFILQCPECRMQVCRRCHDNRL